MLECISTLRVACSQNRKWRWNCCQGLWNALFLETVLFSEKFFPKCCLFSWMLCFLKWRCVFRKIVMVCEMLCFVKGYCILWNVVCLKRVFQNVASCEMLFCFPKYGVLIVVNPWKQEESVYLLEFIEYFWWQDDIGYIGLLAHRCFWYISVREYLLSYFVYTGFGLFMGFADIKKTVKHCLIFL